MYVLCGPNKTGQTFEQSCKQTQFNVLTSKGAEVSRAFPSIPGTPTPELSSEPRLGLLGLAAAFLNQAVLYPRLSPKGRKYRGNLGMINWNFTMVSSTFKIP